jgi:hypothetical protein
MAVIYFLPPRRRHVNRLCGSERFVNMAVMAHIANHAAHVITELATKRAHTQTLSLGDINTCYRDPEKV